MFSVKPDAQEKTYIHSLSCMRVLDGGSLEQIFFFLNVKEDLSV